MNWARMKRARNEYNAAKREALESQSDRTLLESIDNPVNFAELYRRHSGATMAFVLNYIAGDIDVSLDVLAETFWQVRRATGEICPQIGNEHARAQIFGIAAAVIQKWQKAA